MLDQKQREFIAAHNDEVRRRGYLWMVTTGIRGLADYNEVLSAVRSFDRFDLNNDPYGEHDFSSFDWRGQTVNWKIDYYDQELRYWSDPLKKITRRVLTVMLAEEY